MQGLGYGAWGFRAGALGFRVQGSGFKGLGIGFRVQGAVGVAARASLEIRRAAAQASVTAKVPAVAWDVPPYTKSPLNGDYGTPPLGSLFRTVSKRGNIPSHRCSVASAPLTPAAHHTQLYREVVSQLRIP